MGYLAGYSTERFELFILAGILGVTNMIIWGIYGDLLDERFKLTKVLRSLFLGVIYASLMFLSNPQLPLFIVALCTITLERATTEIYKAFIRHERQKKYRIPSDLNLHFPFLIKTVVGYLLILSLLVFFLFVDWQWSYPKLWLALGMGFVVAVGGMLKDAPYEGLEPVKFFRSPAVATIFGVILLLMFPAVSAKYYLFAVAGAERLVSECYKKILRGRKPGKFKKNIRTNKSWRKSRYSLLFMYSLDVALIFLLVFVR